MSWYEIIKMSWHFYFMTFYISWHIYVTAYLCNYIFVTIFLWHDIFYSKLIKTRKQTTSLYKFEFTEDISLSINKWAGATFNARRSFVPRGAVTRTSAPQRNPPTRSWRRRRSAVRFTGDITARWCRVLHLKSTATTSSLGIKRTDTLLSYNSLGSGDGLRFRWCFSGDDVDFRSRNWVPMLLLVLLLLL